MFSYDTLYRTLARSLPDSSVFLFDHNLRFLIAEGRDPGFADDARALEGRRAEDVLAAEAYKLLLPYFRAALEGVESLFQHTFDEYMFAIRFVPVAGDDGEIAAGLMIAQNVTETRQMQTELSQRVRQLTILHEVEAELDDQLNVDYVLTIALDAALRLGEAEAGYIALVEDGEVRLARWVGDYPLAILNMELQEEVGLVGRVLRTQTAECILNVMDDPDHVPLLPRTVDRIVIPLISQETVVGVLNLESFRPHVFDEQKFEFIRLMTARVAVALDNARLYRRAEMQLAELQRLYAKVINLEKLKTDMIRIASHDLRNPLASVMGFLELAQRHLHASPDENVRLYVQEALNGSLRIRKIISDILSLERIEAVAENIYFEEFDFRALVDLVFEEFRLLAADKAQTFTLDAPETPLIINGDSAQLREAVNNLIGNAIKYTPEGGTICVRLLSEAGGLRFEVQDTGYGIKEAQQHRLFEAFFRARSPETREVEGTGLGLHLVRNIIERHDGAMHFTSVYRSGSTFGFTLPARMPAGMPAQTASPLPAR